MKISPENDPIGQALLDYLNTKEEGIVKVDTNLTEDESIPTSYFFRGYEQMPKSEQVALDISKGKILDLGAGSGVHSLELQKKGMNVYPIDISEISVEVMQKRGLEHVRLQDYRDIRDEKYDTILLLMNGIGMVQKIQNIPQFLQQIKGLLNGGGQILIDSTDILYMFEDEEGGGYVIDINGDYYGEMTYYVSYKDIKGEPFAWFYIDFGLLSDYAKAEGFTCEMIVSEDEGHYLAKLTLPEDTAS
jgi:SAM-dependent methyltransferase